MSGARILNLLVEFEGFSGQIPADVEQYQIVRIWLPEKSRGGDVLGEMHLDTVTLQNGRAYVTGSLAAVNEENSFAVKNRATTKWWRGIAKEEDHRGEIRRREQ